MQKTDARHSANAGESKLHFLDYWRVIRVRFGIVLLSFLLVVMTAAAVTYMMPRKYQSTALLEVRTPQDDMGIIGGPATMRQAPMSMDPQFLTTQTEIMRSQEVLYPVVDKEKLPEAWASEGAPLPREVCYAKLASMLELKQRRGTIGLLDLYVMSAKPEEAQRLASAIAESYREARQSRVLDPAEKLRVETESQIEESRKKVRGINDQMAQFRKDHPDVIVENILGSKGELEDPFNVQIANSQADIDKTKAALQGLRNQLEKVSGLKGDDLMRSLPQLNIHEPTVDSVLPKYQSSISNEAAMLNQGLGQNHPLIVAERASRAEYVKQLTSSIASIKNSLAIQLDVQQKTLDSLEESLANMRKDSRLNRTASDQYRTLVDEYTRDKGILDELEKLVAIRKQDAKTPIIPVRILNPANLPTYPSSPKIPLNMAIGVLMGIIVGVGLAFFIEYLDTSVKTMDDVETMLGVPVLAIVPKNIKLLHKQPTDVPDAEAYRILRTNIEFNRKSADANTISMVSGGPGEGKSTTLCNLAFTCAQGGYSVLIVDADLRRPTQHKLFEVNNNIGLTNYLTTNIALEDVILSTPVDNLSLMPSGILPSDAVGILNSQRMSDMIAELKARYDIIFFDSPPILGVSDGAVLASEVDQSIIIVQHRRFPRAMLLRVKQAIQNVGGTVLGVVLNNVDLRHDPNYAYYTSYYEYYAIRTSKDMPAEGEAVGGKSRVAEAGVAGASKGGSSDY